MAAEFAHAINDGRPPLTDGSAGSSGALGARGSFDQPGHWAVGSTDTKGAGVGLMTTNSLAGSTVLVTGGAGTIGSTIVDQLLAANVAEVRVLDNLVRGREANLREVLSDPRLGLVVGDIRDVDLVHDLPAAATWSSIRPRSGSLSAPRSHGSL